jgi:hypothetical protein
MGRDEERDWAYEFDQCMEHRQAEEIRRKLADLVEEEAPDTKDIYIAGPDGYRAFVTNSSAYRKRSSPT